MGATTGDDAPEEVRLTAEARLAMGVASRAVELSALAGELRAAAEIRADDRNVAHVGPRLAGRAVAVRVPLGARVERGEVLAVLDSLELGTRKASFLEARANLAVARRGFERERRLYAKRISAEKDYLEARAELERADAAFRVADEGLRLVGMSDSEITSLDWWVSGHAPPSQFALVAPFAGTVIAQHLTQGELVSASENPYTIADLSRVWGIVRVDEKDAARVADGASVRFDIAALPGAEIVGTVGYISDTLDESTRTIQARVEIENRDGRLRPGMFATARIALPPGDAALWVPAEAIQRVDDRTVGFVEASEGRYLVKALRVGAPRGGSVAVEAGLDPGDRLVTAGALGLKAVLLKGADGRGG